MKKLPVILLIWIVSAASAQGFSPAGAKVQGMAGAGVALPMDASTVYYNPAGIYFQDRIGFDLSLGFQDIEFPGIWGLSYLKYTRSSHQGAGFGVYRIKPPDPLEGDAVAALLATVYELPYGIPIGLSFKYINESWDDSNRKSYFTGDLGVFFPYQSWLVGVALQSVTQPSSRLYPYRVSAGISRSLSGKITAVAQATFDTWDEVKKLENAEYRIGGEFRASAQTVLLGGWVNTADYDYYTGGFGLLASGGLGQLYLAYHYYPDGEEDDRLFVGYSSYLK